MSYTSHVGCLFAFEQVDSCAPCSLHFSFLPIQSDDRPERLSSVAPPGPGPQREARASYMC